MEHTADQEVAHAPVYFAQVKHAQPMEQTLVNVGTTIEMKEESKVAIGVPLHHYPQPPKPAQFTYPTSHVYVAPAHPTCEVKPPSDSMFTFLAVGGLCCFCCVPLFPLFKAWNYRVSAMTSARNGNRELAARDVKNSFKWLKISLLVAGVMAIVIHGVHAILYATESMREYLPVDEGNYEDARTAAIIHESIFTVFLLCSVFACWFCARCQEAPSTASLE